MKPPTTGKFKCSLEDYHNYPAIGSTSLRKLISKTPFHYKWSLDNPSEPTKALQFGTAVHQAMLESKYFKGNVAVVPIFEGRTKRGELTTNLNCAEVREKFDKWHLENASKIIIDEEQMIKIKNILLAISSHKRAAQLISSGHSEESLFWTDPESGMQCKSRPDFIREGHIIVEVKTTQDASARNFFYDSLRYGYHIQAAMQLDAATECFGQVHDTHITIAVESEAPHALQCFQMKPHMIQEGRQLYQAGLLTLKKCQETGSWPAFGDNIVPLELPEMGDL